MAGTTPGITPTDGRTLRLVPNTTRTRRCHGVFIAGEELAVVYSSRREVGKGVVLELGVDVVEHSWAITPAQARSMARALIAAALAVESAQAGSGR